MRKFLLTLVAGLLWLPATHWLPAADRLVFEAQNTPNPKHIVLVAGDEEYRTEEEHAHVGQDPKPKTWFQMYEFFALVDGK